MNNQIQQFVNEWKQATGKAIDYGTCTVVVYEQMEKLQLNYAQYCVMQYIINTSRKTGGAPGWSKATTHTISRDLNFTIQYINEIKKTLLERGLLETKKGMYRLSPNIEWTGARSAARDDKKRSKFDNAVRSRLNLTFREYALLKYIQHMLFFSEYTIASTGQEIVTVTKKMMGEKIDSHRVSIQRMIERLEQRGFLKRISAKKDGRTVHGIYLLVDMEREEDYQLDENNYIYQPGQTVTHN